jgi:hypothetical protein
VEPGMRGRLARVDAAEHHPQAWRKNIVDHYYSR